MIVVRLILTVLLAYVAAFRGGWWLFAALALVGAGIEGQYWINRKSQKSAPFSHYPG